MKPFGFWVDMRGNTLSDPATSWIHALPFGTYQHPVYGEMVFDAAKLTALANSVTSKVRGIDPDIDYDHKADAAKGNQAAGWVKNAEVRGDGLYLQINWTPSAAAEIKEQKYRYFSADFADEWTDAQGTVHKDVLLGGGLTNRPYMKNLVPVNLSELRFDEPPTPPAPPERGDEVDAKQLRAALGLAETATDAEVTAKLAEGVTALSTVTTLTEKVNGLEAENKQLKDPSGGVDPELKKLIEASPAMKRVFDELEAQKKANQDLATAIRLAETERKLAEIQTGKTYALTAPVREELKKVMLASSPEAANSLAGLFAKIIDGSGLVDLSEKGYTGRREGGLGDAGLKFAEMVKQLMEADKNMGYSSAVEEIARREPKLYEEYRNNAYSFKA